MVEEIKIVSLSGRGSIFMKSREYFGYWLDRQNTTWGQVEGQQGRQHSAQPAVVENTAVLGHQLP